MTIPAGATPAGWYPDPAGGQRQRWWDGAQWTEQFTEPYSASAATVVPTAPAGTKVYNLWIWLVVVAPYLSLPLLFAFDFRSMFAGLNFTDPNAGNQLQVEMMTSPAFIGLTVGGWLLGAATVLFAWLDWRWLVAAGVPKPFHWAFGFFGLAGYPVYAIGRAIVTRRRTGHGMAVLWVTIGMMVLSIVVAIVWSATLITAMLDSLQFS